MTASISVNISLGDFSKMIAALKTSFQGMEIAPKNIAAVRQSIKQLQADMRSLNNFKLTNLPAKVSGAKVSGTKVLSGAIEFLAPAVEFERSMDLVRAKFPEMQGSLKDLAGATKKSFAELKDLAQDLGASTVKSASEIAEGMSFLAGAGFSADQVKATIADVTNLSIATNTGMQETADLAATLGAAFFGEDVANQMGRLSDVIAIVANSANVDLGQLGEAMKGSAFVAKQMGVSLEDSAASIGIMAQAGIKGSLAGEAMKNILPQLAAPTDVLKEKMKSLGIEIGEGESNLKRVPELLTSIIKATNGRGNAKQATFLDDLFGNVGITPTLLEGAALKKDEMTDLLLLLKQSEGAAAKIALTMSDNTSGAMALLRSSLEALRIEIGDLFLADVKNLLLGVRELVVDFKNWVENNKSLVKGLLLAGVSIAGLIVVVTTLRRVFINLIIGVKKLGLGLSYLVGRLDLLKQKQVMVAIATKSLHAAKKSWAMINRALTITIKGLGVAMRLLAGPWGLLLAGLSVGAVLIYENWDKIATALKSGLGFLQEIFTRLFHKITTMKATTLMLLGPIGLVVGGLVNGANLIYQNWDAIVGKISSVVNAVVGFSTGLFQGIEDQVGSLLNFVDNVLAKIGFKSIVDLLSKVFNLQTENTVKVNVNINGEKQAVKERYHRASRNYDANIDLSDRGDIFMP